ncbi:TetR/AcrR family transcriptional regulator [Pseudomonas typographi]|uniref:TetR/AcrR family transcriptional regulator n=1 Tax=Pseudomonas typographi TaxID=2715964 RepID=UPI0016895B60|nr:TetR family transcriptional regulator [Pseudomonas typographi]MBD1551594.1 TetR family transcriptional regulator [Pseudomonas typographi]
MDNSKHARAAGRPLRRQQVGKEGVIDAALACLRKVVPQALTMAEVAREAGVDPALVRYYCGDKAGLLRMVTTHLLADVQSRSEALASGTPLRDMVHQRIALILDMSQRNPHFLELVMQEVYFAPDQGGSSEQTHMSQLAATANRGVALSESILQARTEGGREVDARLLHIILLGACTFFGMAQPMLRVLFPEQEQPSALIERYTQTLTDLIVEGIGH